MHNRNEVHACGCELCLVVREARAVSAGGVRQLLQLLFGRSRAGAQSLFDFALGRRTADRFDAGRYLYQAVVFFEFPHEAFLASPVVAVADHVAVEPDAVGQDVDVFMVGVGVAGDDELVIRKAHAVEVAVTDLPPLVIGQFFAGGGGYRGV